MAKTAMEKTDNVWQNQDARKQKKVQAGQK